MTSGKNNRHVFNGYLHHSLFSSEITSMVISLLLGLPPFPFRNETKRAFPFRFRFQFFGNGQERFVSVSSGKRNGNGNFLFFSLVH